MHADYAAVVFEYNTYKLRPQNAARLVRGTKIRCRDGYVVTDAWGRTSVARMPWLAVRIQNPARVSEAWRR